MILKVNGFGFLKYKICGCDSLRTIVQWIIIIIMNSMNPAGFILYSPNYVTTKFCINGFYSIAIIAFT